MRIWEFRLHWLFEGHQPQQLFSAHLPNRLVCLFHLECRMVSNEAVKFIIFVFYNIFLIDILSDLSPKIYYSFILPTWFGLLGCSFRFGGKFSFAIYGSYGRWQTEGRILYNQLRTLSFLGTDGKKSILCIATVNILRF